MEASRMGATHLIPKSEQLQLWANDPDLARKNLRSILSAVESDESLIDWATEALENCGSPAHDELEFLQNQLQSSSNDVIYWACKLIGRMGPFANPCQPALCQVATSESSDAVKQQALIALGRVGTLKDESRISLQQIAKSQSANLSSLASKLLESPS
jgi:HEAT repeats